MIIEYLFHCLCIHGARQQISVVSKLIYMSCACALIDRCFSLLTFHCLFVAAAAVLAEKLAAYRAKLAETFPQAERHIDRCTEAISTRQLQKIPSVDPAVKVSTVHACTVREAARNNGVCARRHRQRAV